MIIQKINHKLKANMRSHDAHATTGFLSNYICWCLKQVNKNATNQDADIPESEDHLLSQYYQQCEVQEWEPKEMDVWSNKKKF